MDKSVNDGILKEDCSLTYIKVDTIVDSIWHWVGALLAKMDVKSAFRNIPVHALEWISERHGVNHGWHYLDDFLMTGMPGSEECQNNKS
jgi:hypothetical protein